MRTPEAIQSAIMLALVGCQAAVSPEPPRAPAVSHPHSTILHLEPIDLSHTFDASTVYWPTSPGGFELKPLHNGPTEAGFFYAANSICAPEHGGTHLDAPLHFAEGRASTEAIPLARLVAPGVVIDIREDAAQNADALLEPHHIEAYEADNGLIDKGDIVLVLSGWSERWPDRKRYMGDDTPGDASNLHFPGVSKAAAELLVERQVAAVGIDTASIDHGPSKDFIAHQVLMAANIPAFENVTSLEQLPSRGAVIVALPMKIGGGSGGPLRIIALVPSEAPD